MKKIALIFGVLLLTSCSNEEFAKEHIQKMTEIAKACKDKVIKSSLVPAYSRFDAYYDPSNSQWSYIGTEEESFKFRKCLIENGVKLGDEKK
jgi:hypothetical protein